MASAARRRQTTSMLDSASVSADANEDSEPGTNLSLSVPPSSRYWNSWKNSKLYTLTVHLFRADLDMMHHETRGVNPRAQIFVTRDRSTTQSTAAVKNTTTPEWNHSFQFTGLEYEEEICVEIMSEKMLSHPTVLATTFFCVGTIVELSPKELQCKRFNVAGEKAHGGLWAGFDFDPPVPSTLGARFGRKYFPVYMNVQGPMCGLILHAFHSLDDSKTGVSGYTSDAELSHDVEEDDTKRELAVRRRKAARVETLLENSDSEDEDEDDGDTPASVQPEGGTQALPGRASA